jgi:hypothetical protein
MIDTPLLSVVFRRTTTEANETQTASGISKTKVPILSKCLCFDTNPWLQ